MTVKKDIYFLEWTKINSLTEKLKLSVQTPEERLTKPIPNYNPGVKSTHVNSW
jgi:hypothetical protein